MNLLYEPMLARDIPAIPQAVTRFRKAHSSVELFQTVARFALLAASPSQHGKHALIACVSAKEIEETLPERYDDLLTECAIYAAQSRLPWSEPPVTEPPAVEPDHPVSLDEIREAIADRDRLRGERWLAARIRLGGVAGDFFTVAAEGLADFGHNLIVAVAVWKLALLVGQPESYGFLRVAVGEWTSHSAEEQPRGVASAERQSVIRQLVDELASEQGSIEAFHRLALGDAAIEAGRLARDSTIEQRVLALLSPSLSPSSGAGRAAARPYSTPSPSPLPIYRLARDYAEYLKAFAISQRLEPWADRRIILAAAKYNLDHAPSFEEWSFA